MDGRDCAVGSPSRRVRLQSPNPRVQKQSNIARILPTTISNQVPALDSSMQSVGGIFPAPTHDKTSLLNLVRQRTVPGVPSRERSTSRQRQRFPARSDSPTDLRPRTSKSAMMRPTTPAEQRQTINKLIGKTTFFLEVLENPHPDQKGIGLR